MGFPQTWQTSFILSVELEYNWPHSVTLLKTFYDRYNTTTIIDLSFSLILALYSLDMWTVCLTYSCTAYNDKASAGSLFIPKLHKMVMLMDHFDTKQMCQRFSKMRAKFIHIFYFVGLIHDRRNGLIHFYSDVQKKLKGQCTVL